MAPKRDLVTSMLSELDAAVERCELCPTTERDRCLHHLRDELAA